MDQDKNITTASIEGEVENVSANDIKEEQEATVTEHKKKNKRNNDKAKISKAAKANAQPIEKEKKRKQKNFRMRKSVQNKDNINNDNTNNNTSGDNKEKKSSLLSGIKAKLIMTSLLPTVVGIVVVLILAIVNISQGMNTEAVNGLSLLGQSTKASYDNEYTGDWRVDNNGNLFKGDVNLSQKQDGIDKFTKDGDADLAVFIGVDCKLTSLRDSNNKRMLSLKADEKIWEAVQKGNTYTSSHVDIDGTDYTGVYIPLKNFSGSVVGMMFSGQPRTDITAFIMQKIIALISVSIVVLIVVIVVASIISTKLANALVSVNNLFIALANGDLTVDVNKSILARKDEIGQMAQSVQTLIDKLQEIVANLQNTASELHRSGEDMTSSANQSSKATEEISSAVEDISKGAVSQAEEIQNASAQIANMGELISEIVEKVANLTKATDAMGRAGDTSMSTMSELSDSNDHTTESINNIANQINITNESVGRIGEAAALITNIADQTSLLALNASIESARAGEAGKGFAVVASEIQKLASQSDEAAGEIKEIIEKLQLESEKTVEDMNNTKVLINEQIGKLDATKNSFIDVSDGIAVSRNETAVIENNAGSCDEARKQINDVVSNLSAISEENAASAQQTTASMQELTATINMLAETANGLMTVSEQLNNEVKFFKVK